MSPAKSKNAKPPRRSEPAPRAWTEHPAWALALLALLAAFAYTNALEQGFAYDDHLTIVRNERIAGVDKIPALFTSGYWIGPGRVYRPLPLATFALNYAAGGLDPFGYHLVNVLLHLLVSWTFYGLARRLGFSAGAALASAAVFTVHPLHTEAVTGIIGRAELLMSLGLLLSLIWYIDAGAPAKFDSRYAIASLAAFGTALFSKEQAMMVPAVLVLYDLTVWRSDEPWSRRIKPALTRYFWYLLVLVVFLTVLVIVTGSDPVTKFRSVNFLDNPLAHQHGPLGLLSAIKASGVYLRLFIWPEHLSADYSYNAIPLTTGLLDPRALASLAAWGGLLGLALWSYFRGTRRAFFAVGFMLVTFLPASNFIVPIGTIFGERLFYLPSAGLCLLIAVAWDGLGARHPLNIRKPLGQICIGSLAVIALLLGVRTIDRNRDWRDNLSLFASATRVVPESAKAWANLAAAEGDRGNVRAALHSYETAMRIYPDYPHRHPLFAQGIGMAFAESGRLEEGLRYLRIAARRRTKAPDIKYNLGVALLQRSAWREAEEWLRGAIAADPDYTRAYIALSTSLRKQGRPEEALEAAGRAIRIDSDAAAARLERAAALEELGRVAEAIQEYERAAKITQDPALEQKILELRKSRGRRSEVGGPRSEIRGPKSEVGGRRSEVGSRRSGAKVSSSDLRSPTSDLGFRTSDFGPPTSDFGLRTSDLRPLTSDL